MAYRSVYVPDHASLGVREVSLEFEWFPGFSSSQKRRSIASLHAAADNQGISPILEISSKSVEECGVKASAFNLLTENLSTGKQMTVEAAFQGSKVSENAGPFPDIYKMDSREAKREIRNRLDGALIKFNFFGHEFPSEPKTFFYDWLYINALHRHAELANQISNYAGFSDIEFNPKKSINCQAFSAALYVTLRRSGQLDDALFSPQSFIDVLKELYAKREQQAHPLV